MHTAAEVELGNFLPSMYLEKTSTTIRNLSPVCAMEMGVAPG